MVELRDYQHDALQKLDATSARAIIMHAPTGAGKTVIAGEILRRAVADGRRALFIAHREELIDQTVAVLGRFDVECGTITAHGRTDLGKSVQVAMVQTLARRPAPVADVVIVDECHLSLAATYQTILANYPSAKVIGLTATPSRLDGKPLGLYWDDMIQVSSVEKLIAAQMLVGIRLVKSQFGDMLMAGAKVGFTGEFDAAATRERVSVRNADIAAAYEEHAGDRKSIIFATTQAHAHTLAQLIRGSRAVDANSTRGERADAVAALKAGDIRALINVALFTEGFDEPSVDAIVLARPTASRVLHFQMIGRGMRPYEGKTECLVLDCVGNTARHGRPDTSCYWNIHGDAAPVVTLPNDPAFDAVAGYELERAEAEGEHLGRKINGGGETVEWIIEGESEAKQVSQTQEEQPEGQQAGGEWQRDSYAPAELEFTDEADEHEAALEAVHNFIVENRAAFLRADATMAEIEKADAFMGFAEEAGGEVKHFLVAQSIACGEMCQDYSRDTVIRALKKAKWIEPVGGEDVEEKPVAVYVLPGLPGKKFHCMPIRADLLLSYIPKAKKESAVAVARRKKKDMEMFINALERFSRSGGRAKIVDGLLNLLAADDAAYEGLSAVPTWVRAHIAAAMGNNTGDEMTRRAVDLVKSMHPDVIAARVMSWGKAEITLAKLDAELRKKAVKELNMVGKKRGYKPGWAWHKAKELGLIQQ